MEIRSLRWNPSDREASATFSLASKSSGFLSDDRMGAMITGGPDGRTPVLWLPRGVLAARIDRHGRLKTVDDGVAESWWELEGVPKLHLRASAAEALTVFVPMVAFGEGMSVSQTDLFELQGVELQRYLKSDWFVASSVADLWKYLVNGSVYDPRGDGQGRFRCQQCAFTWWGYLMALHLETSKPHYRALARWIAWSVCVDLDDDGSWRHGFWKAEPEIHARFLWEGVRLLLAENSVAPDPVLLDAARRAGLFALEHLSEVLEEDRLWFLHDSEEGATQLRIGSQVLGRSPRNSLCLNTHVQALCVLHELALVTPDDDRFSRGYRRGLEGLEAVLELRGGTWVTVALGRVLPVVLDWKVPNGARERVLRFLFYRAAVGLYWWVRKSIPGLVFGNGYLDRDLGATMLADEYHVVNLKDLLELYRLDQKPWLRRVIEDAAAFVATLDFRRCLERNPIWSEWSDVLEMWAPDLVDVGVDSGKVETEVLDQFGGLSIDTFCHRAGVWPAAGGTSPKARL